MKKLFTILTVMLFSLTTFTSCEKGITNESQTLSEFVIGEWETSTIYMNGHFEPFDVGAVISLISITANDKYAIYRIHDIYRIHEWGNRIIQSEGNYIIYEDTNTITITGVDYQNYSVYYVTWMGDTDTMIWTEYNESDNPQIIKWTRS